MLFTLVYQTWRSPSNSWQCIQLSIYHKTRNSSNIAVICQMLSNLPSQRWCIVFIQVRPATQMHTIHCECSVFLADGCDELLYNRPWTMLKPSSSSK